MFVVCVPGTVFVLSSRSFVFPPPTLSFSSRSDLSLIARPRWTARSCSICMSASASTRRPRSWTALLLLFSWTRPSKKCAWEGTRTACALCFDCSLTMDCSESAPKPKVIQRNRAGAHTWHRFYGPEMISKQDRSLAPRCHKMAQKHHIGDPNQIGESPHGIVVPRLARRWPHRDTLAPNSRSHGTHPFIQLIS